MADQEVITLGIVGMENMGEYNSQTRYEKLNIVSYNGSSYCAKGDVQGVLPTDTDYWQLIAEKGESGETGPEGPKPVKGVDYYTEQDILELESTLSGDVTNEVSSQLNDLTSGTPLVADSIAEMVDTTRIYVNTSDGHWYWYNGSSWVDGGLYQAAEDSDTLELLNDRFDVFESDFINEINISSFTWEIGSIANNGYKTVTDKAIRMLDAVKMDKGSYFYLSNYSDGKAFKIFVYPGTSYNTPTWNTDNWQTDPVVIPYSGYVRVVIKNTNDLSDTSISQYLTGLSFTQKDVIFQDDLDETNKNVNYNSTKIQSLYNINTESADPTTDLTWESGLIYENGMKGNNAKCIRTVEFKKCLKGSVFKLSDYTNAELRIIVYPNASFTTPLEATAWLRQSYTTQNDGYVMAVIYDRNNDIVDIGTYSSLYGGILITEIKNKVYTLPSSWTNNIKEFKKLQGTKNAIGIQTDVHYSIATNDNINIANNLKEFTNYFGLDYICNLGDIIKGYQTDTLDDMKLSFTEIIHRYIDNCRCPFLYSTGNHEDCSLIPQEGGTHNLDGYILGNEIYANTIPFVNNTGSIIDNKKLYYYKDFKDYRVIVLNTRDIDFQRFDVTDINVNNHKIGEDQITWLTNVALNTTKPVIIMSHVPLINSLLPDEHAVTNASRVVSILESFVSNGGTIIAVLSGHSHQQSQDKINGINYITFKNGGVFAELLFIDLVARTIDTKLIGDIPSGISDRSFTY